MAAKSKKVEKVKAPRPLRQDRMERLKEFNQKKAAPPPGGEIDRLVAAEEKLSTGPGRLDDNEAAGSAEMVKPEPQALTLPLITDSATLFIRGVQQLTAQLLGQPESAVMLVKVNGWLDDLGKVKKLIVGDDDKVEGLKAKVISDGEPWGEKGSKQLTLAGAVVKVKAVNWRDPDAPLSINDLDAGKVEAYIRGIANEGALSHYMKATTVWGLKDLTPVQAKNLNAMLADPGEYGQGLRQCLKETKYQMMAPEMEGQ